MTAVCSDMTSRLDAACSHTRELLAATSDVNKKLNTVNIQSQVLSHFLARFELSADHEALLTSSKPLTPEVHLSSTLFPHF
jgi:hypothetical protein